MAFRCDRVIVSAVNTPTRLSASTLLVRHLMIGPLLGNAGNVFVGDEGVNNTTVAQQGHPLGVTASPLIYANESPIDLSEMFVIGAGSSDGVTWSGDVAD